MPIKKTIGSNKNSEIVISGKYVSEKHALLIEDGEAIYIEDLSSTFGTHVNGKRITKRTRLEAKDRVKIGTQLFHWKNYLDQQGGVEPDPILPIDLIRPTGIVSWKVYKYILMIALGVAILIPIAVPAFLGYVEAAMNRRRTTDLVNLIQYTDILWWLTSILTGYIFVNLTQKAIRGKMKG